MLSTTSTTLGLSLNVSWELDLWGRLAARARAGLADQQAAEADFEVIPLQNVDPYLAVSLLEEMLDLPGPLDDPEDIDPDAPKIDADPGNMRLEYRPTAAGLQGSVIERLRLIVGEETLYLVDVAGQVGDHGLVISNRAGQITGFTPGWQPGCGPGGRAIMALSNSRVATAARGQSNDETGHAPL